MVDVVRVREFLGTACDADVPLDRLDISYVQAGPRGPERLLLSGPGRNGEPLRVTARRVNVVKGPQLEAAINARPIAATSPTGFLQAALYAPALELLFQIFPVDDHLPTLPTAVDPSAMRPILESALAPAGAQVRLRRVVARVMRYKPGRKCLLRYQLSWAGAEQVGLPGVVWARLSRRAKFERICENLPRLRSVAAEIDFELPAPLGILPDLAMELFSPVSGVPLFTLVHRDDFPALCRRVGEGLLRFHGLRVAMTETFDVEAQVARLEENAIEFACMLSSERGRITALARELSDRLRRATPSPPRLIHRDFHGDNILVGDWGLVLLDFEDCAMGEPADDVGSNWAQLTWHMRKAATSALPEAGRRAFLDAYLAKAHPATARCLPTYAAMHCFLYAHQCLRHPQDARRYQDAAAMLAACEAVLEHGLR